MDNFEDDDFLEAPEDYVAPYGPNDPITILHFNGMSLPLLFIV